MPTTSGKTSRKTSFFLLGCRHYDAIAHCFFLSLDVAFVLTYGKKFIDTLTPPNNRDIHIEEFFVDSIYSKTKDIIINFFFI